MSKKDVRWQQRFSNYQKALKQLNKAIAISEEGLLSDLEKQGMIQAFEFTHELSWKVMKDFLNEKGNNEIYGSKDAVRAAFLLGLISKGEAWMDMIDSRNMSSHTYDEDTAELIVEKVIDSYGSLFREFEAKMLEIAQTENGQMNLL